MSKIKKNSVVFAVIIALISTFFLVCAACQEAIISYYSNIDHNRIKENYISTTENYIYVSDKEIEKRSIDVINDIIKKIPPTLSEEIKENWLILVSNTPPYKNSEYANPAGMTNYNARVIWLEAGFSEEVLAHEIGHVFGDTLGSVEYSKSFYALYNSYAYEYVECGKNEITEYTASSSVEFFAMLFKEYVCHSDYLKENFKEGYNYIENKTNASWYTGLWGHLMGNLFATYNTISLEARSISSSLSIIPNILGIEEKVSNNPTIDVTQYEGVLSYSGLSAESIIAVEEIFDVINNPEKYGNESIVTIEHSGYISLSSYQEIYSFFDFYLGKEKSEIIDICSNKKQKTSTIRIKLDEALLLKQKIDKCLDKVEEALGEMHEGTETEKLLQISKFIHENCSYELRDGVSVSEFWEEGKGDCLTYAMTFRLFCQRIGIECDIIFADTGTMAHSWNRVKLSDGSYKYYDLTCYNFLKLDMVEYRSTDVVYINNYLWN